MRSTPRTGQACRSLFQRRSRAAGSVTASRWWPRRPSTPVAYPRSLLRVSISAVRPWQTIALLLAAPALASAAEHPRLVSVEAADCTLCHGELTEGRPVVHAPVGDDCSTCHEFSVGEAGTTVSLMAEGNELCLFCHDDLEAAANADLEAPHFPVADSCLNCHDPHASEHEYVLAEGPREICAECHDLEDVDGAHGIPVSRADCRTCHDPHGSQVASMLNGSHPHAPFADGSCLGCHRRPRGTKVRLRNEGGDLCYSCHADKREAFAGLGAHGVVQQGRCIECHDPHIADRPKTLKAEGAELCFGCHADVRIKVEGEGVHAAVESGCDTCHDPHRGEHRALLLEAPIETCLLCHDAEDEELIGRHLGADLTAAACTSCHDPHGSEEAPLLATGSLHPPFQDDCETCHEGSASQLMEGGGAELCYLCHDDIQELAAEAAVPHEAMEFGECTLCHSPHASLQAKLLKAPGGQSCAECHDDKVASGTEEFAHGAASWLGCHSCHEPHGGEREHLLKAPAEELCRGCHLNTLVRRAADGSVTLPGGWRLEGERAARLRLVDLDARGRGHPLPDHPVDGMVPEDSRAELAPEMLGQQIGCVTCHDPHVGKSPRLFADGARSQFEHCAKCHPK